MPAFALTFKSGHTRLKRGRSHIKIPHRFCPIYVTAILDCDIDVRGTVINAFGHVFNCQICNVHPSVAGFSSLTVIRLTFLRTNQRYRCSLYISQSSIFTTPYISFVVPKVKMGRKLPICGETNINSHNFRTSCVYTANNFTN